MKSILDLLKPERSNRNCNRASSASSMSIDGYRLSNNNNNRSDYMLHK